MSSNPGVEEPIASSWLNSIATNQRRPRLHTKTHAVTELSPTWPVIVTPSPL